MSNYIMPMAGNGSRFRDAGYILPKPLIVAPRDYGRMNIPMFIGAMQTAREAFFSTEDDLYVFICRREHELAVRSWLQIVPWQYELVLVDEVTGGAAESVALAEEVLVRRGRLHLPTVVVNSDQYIYTLSCVEIKDKPLVLCFQPHGDLHHLRKWSYVIDGHLVEKPQTPPPSGEGLGTVGVYGLPSGQALFDGIRAMKAAEFRVNGEYYFAPSLNFTGLPIQTELVYSMAPLGTPEDLNRYLEGLK